MAVRSSSACGLLARRRELSADVGERGLELLAATIPGRSRLGEAPVRRVEIRARRRGGAAGGGELGGTISGFAAGRLHFGGTISGFAARSLQLDGKIGDVATRRLQLGALLGRLVPGRLQLGAPLSSFAAHSLQFGAPLGRFVARGLQLDGKIGGVATRRLQLDGPLVEGGADRRRSAGALGLQDGEPDRVSCAGDLVRTQPHLPLARARTESGR